MPARKSWVQIQITGSHSPLALRVALSKARQLPLAQNFLVPGFFQFQKHKATMAAPACECSVKLACTPASEGKSGTATYTLGAVTTLATTIVAWGGLSSLQDLVYGLPTHEVFTNLQATYGFPSVLYVSDVNRRSMLEVNDHPDDTQSVFRYYWFHLAWSVVACALLIGLIYANKFAQFRGAITGIFVVGTLLYIQASDAFLSANDNPYWGEGQAKDRMRATVAGFIMTAAMNAIMVLLLGWECSC